MVLLFVLVVLLLLVLVVVVAVVVVVVVVVLSMLSLGKMIMSLCPVAGGSKRNCQLSQQHRVSFYFPVNPTYPRYFCYCLCIWNI